MGRDSQTWSPLACDSATVDDELRGQVATIEAALKENGQLRRGDLKQRVNARRWGPGCFARALNEAQAVGIVTSLGRDSYALSSDVAVRRGVRFVAGDRELAGRR